MKKRNYVVAISLIALLGQTGGLSAMDWARQKAGSAKTATQKATGWTKQKASASVDSLYKKAKDFVKEVKTLKRCHKDGDCTPAQYRKIKRMGVALAVTATAVVVGVGIGTTALGFGLKDRLSNNDQDLSFIDKELVTRAKVQNKESIMVMLPESSIDRRVYTLRGLEVAKEEIKNNTSLDLMDKKEIRERLELFIKSL